MEFFSARGHEIVPSAPMVVKGDPTLMFINSGMAPFKNWFLGNETPRYRRVADTQKCLRVSGKHNDLEEVGVDTYHHTMFEMLGNWSFGDYFKQEAISWAWELLTDVYKIPADRLYVTVFEGDPAEDLAFDQEAYDIWKARIAEDRILRGNKKDNFWEMGDTGPCGPCSEIHVDLRSDEERSRVDGKTLVNNDHPQVVEIWNNVFMQFERRADGSLIELPSKHVDTGMGFERLCMALQGKTSNYDTDVFTPLISAVESITGMRYERSVEKRDVAMRVISDHIRAVSFAICDGQLPGSSGAGYVIRRILRRAIRYGYSFLGMKEPFIYRLVAVLAAEMGDFFPEIRNNRDLVARVIREEEEGFLRTLENGIRLLDEIMARTSGDLIDGRTVFELYDTFGFPVDLTGLIAAEGHKRIDQTEFEHELSQQKERSRAATRLETEDWVELSRGETTFVGYDELECETRILRYRKIRAKNKEHFQLVLDVTPFYAESGGQVGDTGRLVSANETIRITDTKKENNLVVHFADALPEKPEGRFRAIVDRDRRKEMASNHSATHLLHEALREVLGTHVEQKGSLVHPDYLRFDFSHFSRVADDELESVATRVNERIRKNLTLEENRNMPIAEARETGAMMLFGEKYGDLVRVIRFGTSVELCGGTHVRSTGEIGSFVIRSEGAVAAGVRRIEAISASAASAYVKDELAALDAVRKLLKSGDPVKAVSDLQARLHEQQKQLEAFQHDKAMQVKKEWLTQVKEEEGVRWLIARTDLGSAALKDVAFQLKNEVPGLFAVFGSEGDGKALLTCVIAEDLVASRNLNASAIVRELAKHIQGGGGGQPFFATAGGPRIEGLEEALHHARKIIR